VQHRGQLPPGTRIDAGDDIQEEGEVGGLVAALAHESIGDVLRGG